MCIYSPYSFIGIVDVLELKELRFDQTKDGRIYSKIPLAGDVLKEATDKRYELIDHLSGIDDRLAEKIIENNSLDNIDNGCVNEAIRRSTITQKIVPVFLGSAYKNVGVQRLMNSIISYLPAPSETDSIYSCFG